MKNNIKNAVFNLIEIIKINNIC